MRYLLRVLFTPSCWVRARKVDRVWDRVLNEVLDTNPEIKRVDAYRASINGYQVWVENCPYSALKSPREGLPTRRTVFRFFDLYQPMLDAADKRYEKTIRYKLMGRE